LLHELNRANQGEQQKKRFSEDVIEALMEYSWPGNVRELKNFVHSAFILADDIIGVEDLPAEVVSGHRPVAPAGQWDGRGAGEGTDQEAGRGDDQGEGDGLGSRPGTTIAEAERQLIDATLEHCDGNRTRAAEMLGISVKTLYNRLKDYAESDE